jgi:hypothetical protein
MNLFTRIELIRNLHYLSIGLFQKRDSQCHLKVRFRILKLDFMFNRRSMIEKSPMLMYEFMNPKNSLITKTRLQ